MAYLSLYIARKTFIFSFLRTSHGALVLLGESLGSNQIIRRIVLKRILKTIENYSIFMY